MIEDDLYTNTIPPVFCWTKMGTEAGQSLDQIIHRKELERTAGEGIFAWGIGNSLGTSPDLAREYLSNSNIEVLFSPMKSPAKAIDVAPTEILLWLSYIDRNGVETELPKYVAITSRGTNAKLSGKRAHYALLCYSTDVLCNKNIHTTLNFNCAKNFTTKNRLGASQVTAMVHYEEKSSIETIKAYDIAFKAYFYKEGFVRLSNPVKIEKELKELYQKLCNSKNVQEWQENIGILKYTAKEINAKLKQQTLF